MANEKIVILRGPSILLALQPEDDEVAGAEILPGMLLAYNDDGELIPHDTADGSRGPGLIALERDEVNKDLETVYPVGDSVKRVPIVTGCEANMPLDVNQDITKGDPLTSAGNGRVHAAAGSAADRIVGYAAEDMVTTGAMKRIAVRFA